MLTTAQRAGVKDAICSWWAEHIHNICKSQCATTSLYLIQSKKKNMRTFSIPNLLYTLWCGEKIISLEKQKCFLYLFYFPLYFFEIPPTDTNSKPSKSPLIPGKLNCQPIISRVQSAVSKMQQQRSTQDFTPQKMSRTFAWDCSFVEGWRGAQCLGEQRGTFCI